MPSKQRNVNGQKDQKKSVIIDLMSASIRAKRAEEQHREDGGQGVGKTLKVSCLHHTGGADVGASVLLLLYMNVFKDIMEVCVCLRVSTLCV